MSCGPVCIVLVQGIPAGLVTLTVGVVGGLIAHRQATVAEAKLKLDLFEKRYPIFQEIPVAHRTPVTPTTPAAI